MICRYIHDMWYIQNLSYGFERYYFPWNFKDIIHGLWFFVFPWNIKPRNFFALNQRFESHELALGHAPTLLFLCSKYTYHWYLSQEYKIKRVGACPKAFWSDTNLWMKHCMYQILGISPRIFFETLDIIRCLRKKRSEKRLSCSCYIETFGYERN